MKWKRSNPDNFGKCLSLNVTNRRTGEPTTEQFYDHLKNIATHLNTRDEDEINDFFNNCKDNSITSTFGELDIPISRNEIPMATQKLNRNKAAASDNK